MTRTQVFKESWAHTGKIQQYHSYYPREGTKPHKVEQVPTLHAEFWRMVGEEMRQGYLMGFIG